MREQSSPFIDKYVVRATSKALLAIYQLYSQIGVAIAESRVADSDKKFEPSHTLFCCSIKICSDLRTLHGIYCILY